MSASQALGSRSGDPEAPLPCEIFGRSKVALVPRTNGMGRRREPTTNHGSLGIARKAKGLTQSEKL